MINQHLYSLYTDSGKSDDPNLAKERDPFLYRRDAVLPQIKCSTAKKEHSFGTDYADIGLHGLLLRTQSMALFLASSDGSIRYVNNAFCALIRCNEQELLRTHVADIMDSGDRQSFMRKLQQQHETFGPLMFQMEVLFKTRTGNTFRGLIITKRVSSEKGLSVCLLQDLSKEHANPAKLHASNGEAQEIQAASPQAFNETFKHERIRSGRGAPIDSCKNIDIFERHATRNPNLSFDK